MGDSNKIDIPHSGRYSNNTNSSIVNENLYLMEMAKDITVAAIRNNIIDGCSSDSRHWTCTVNAFFQSTYTALSHIYKNSP